MGACTAGSQIAVDCEPVYWSTEAHWSPVYWSMELAVEQWSKSTAVEQEQCVTVEQEHAWSARQAGAA